MKLNNSYIGLRLDLLKYITNCDNVIMDVGCATGVNGKYLLENGLADKVYGIEYHYPMAAEAAEIYNKVFEGDLNNALFRKKVIENSPKVDYLLFGDVLEHLYQPNEVLTDLLKILDSQGKIIISLPNIAHIETFIQVFIKGTWPRNERGIFDNTHVRWFTKKDAFSMVERCGLKVIEYERKFRARDALGSQFDWKYNCLKYLNKDWVTFQHILQCGFK